MPNESGKKRKFTFPDVTFSSGRNKRKVKGRDGDKGGWKFPKVTLSGGNSDNPPPPPPPDYDNPYEGPYGTSTENGGWQFDDRSAGNGKPLPKPPLSNGPIYWNPETPSGPSRSHFAGPQGDIYANVDKTPIVDMGNEGDFPPPPPPPVPEKGPSALAFKAQLKRARQGGGSGPLPSPTTPPSKRPAKPGTYGAVGTWRSSWGYGPSSPSTLPGPVSGPQLWNLMLGGGGKVKLMPSGGTNVGEGLYGFGLGTHESSSSSSSSSMSVGSNSSSSSSSYGEEGRDGLSDLSEMFKKLGIDSQGGPKGPRTDSPCPPKPILKKYLDGRSHGRGGSVVQSSNGDKFWATGNGSDRTPLQGLVYRNLWFREKVDVFGSWGPYDGNNLGTRARDSVRGRGGRGGRGGLPGRQNAIRRGHGGRGGFGKIGEKPLSR